MLDPALGNPKAYRALGKETPGTKTGKAPLKAKRSRINEFRQIDNGQFSGPRPSYGRYQVSEQAADILNRSLRSMNKEY
jgi:hypothetical protein